MSAATLDGLPAYSVDAALEFIGKAQREEDAILSWALDAILETGVTLERLAIHTDISAGAQWLVVDGVRVYEVRQERRVDPPALVIDGRWLPSKVACDVAAKHPGLTS